MTEFKKNFFTDPSLKVLNLFIILFQLIISFIVLTPFLINYDLKVYTEIMDGPGYMNFDFSNIKIILDQQRTFGGPLIIKLYQIFDENLLHWPKFIYIIYSLSNLILLNSLIKFNFSKIFSFFLILGLTFSNTLYAYTAYLSELLGISFVILFISFFFHSLRTNKLFYYIIFSLFLFFSYQIRPGFVVFVFLPIIYFFLRNFRLNYKILLFSFSPLIIFLAIRFFLVGSIGLVSFNAGLPAHSMVYLTKDEIPKLSITNQKLARKFFERKNNIYYPCNLDSIDKQYEFFKTNKKYEEPYKKNPYTDITYGQYPCWNDYHMITWLETIKILKGIEPFDNESYKNQIAWLHVKTLANFWNEAAPLTEVNNVLLEFSSEVLSLHKKEIFIRFLKSPMYLIKLHRDADVNLLVFYIIVIFLVIFFKRQKNINYNKGVSEEVILIGTFAFITVGNLIILYLHQNGTPRDVMIHTFYLVPVIMSYIVFLVYKNLSDKIRI